MVAALHRTVARKMKSAPPQIHASEFSKARCCSSRSPRPTPGSGLGVSHLGAVYVQHRCCCWSNAVPSGMFFSAAQPSGMPQ